MHKQRVVPTVAVTVGTKKERTIARVFSSQDRVPVHRKIRKDISKLRIHNGVDTEGEWEDLTWVVSFLVFILPACRQGQLGGTQIRDQTSRTSREN